VPKLTVCFYIDGDTAPVGKIAMHVPPDASLEKLIDDTKASLEKSVALLNAGRGTVAVGEVIAQGGKVGELRLQPSGRWAVCRPGHDPAEITSGELFRVEIDGVLQVRRMEYKRRGYCALGGPPLCSGMRATIGVEALPKKKR
jgi:hypothetical protein